MLNKKRLPDRQKKIKSKLEFETTEAVESIHTSSVHENLNKNTTKKMMPKHPNPNSSDLHKIGPILMQNNKLIGVPIIDKAMPPSSYIKTVVSPTYNTYINNNTNNYIQTPSNSQNTSPTNINNASISMDGVSAQTPNNYHVNMNITNININGQKNQSIMKNLMPSLKNDRDDKVILIYSYLNF